MNINWSPILRDPHSSIYLSIVALKRLGFIKRFINRYVHDITPINVDTMGLNIFIKSFEPCAKHQFLKYGHLKETTSH